MGKSRKAGKRLAHIIIFCLFFENSAHDKQTMSSKRSFTNSKKLKMLAESKRVMQEGGSLRSAARMHNIQPQLLRRWLRKEVLIRGMRTTAKTTGEGRKGMLAPHENDLITWFVDQREVGCPISTQILCVRAGQVCPAFRALT